MPHSLLMLDPRNIAESRNSALSLGAVQKSALNPLFREDFFAEPPITWEARYDNLYPTVIFDETDRLFKCWYSAFIRDGASQVTPLEMRPSVDYPVSEREEGLLYATSSDGLNWEKPALGLIEFAGDRGNNLLMRRATHGLHAGGVLKDSREPDPRRRYKFLHRNLDAGKMAVAFSADGLRWSPPIPWPRHDAAGDCHNNALWAPELGKYVGITRGWSGERYFQGERTVLRSESDDFLHWTQPEEILRGRDPHDQLYSMPIFRYGELYLGLPAVLRHGGRDAPDWDLVDTELALSLDTVHWERICPGQALIPRGAGQYPTGDYDCGCVYAAAPVVLGDEILLYYGGSNGKHTSWREGSFNLASLKRDRFAGHSPCDAAEPASVTTNPLRLAAEPPAINAAIAPGGSIRASVQTADGAALPGFGLEDCRPMTESGLDIPLRWRDASLDRLGGESLRLVFHIKGATLYALAGFGRA